MTLFEKIIVVALSLISLSFVGYIVSSWTSQGNPAAAAPSIPVAAAAPAATPAAPEPETPRVLPAPAPLDDAPEHIAGACISKVRGLIPNGTTVKGMSVAYKHSVDKSHGSSRIVHSTSDINFYTVTVNAEIEGRRFSSSYVCRQWGNAIEIMRS